MLRKLSLFLLVAATGTAAHAQTTVSTAKTEPATTTFVVKAEVPPQFRGGQTTLQRFINNRMQYPARALRENVQGDVVLAFHVDEKGECSKFRVLSGIGSGCDEEALRVAMEMPRWVPARTKGKAVAVDMQMPVSFRINNTLELEDTRRTKNKFR